MKIDYAAVGKRIKKFRKHRKMSQERLSEMIDVSVPHMSNIENGKTKFSLQVLVDLASALEVTPDMLLFDRPGGQEKSRYMIVREIGQELEDCTMEQMLLIADVVRNTKKVLKEYDRRLGRQEEPEKN